MTLRRTVIVPLAVAAGMLTRCPFTPCRIAQSFWSSPG